jgi:phospholipid/cholesterol/gamma-HCH transport system substrate-binding protein
VVAAAAFTYFIMRTSKNQFSSSETYVLYADFEDASGIRYKTQLQINGIDVGKIDGITHVREPSGRLKARVKLSLLKDYPVYENAILRKVPESLLGDFRLDLDPGTPAAPVIPPGGIIPHVQSRSDLEQIEESLKNVTSNVNQVTESLSHVLAGPEGEGSIKAILENVERSMRAIEETTRAVSEMVTRNDQVIDGIINNVGRFSGEMATMAGPGGDLRKLTDNLATLSSRLDHIAASVDSMVGGDHELPGGRGEIRETLDNLNDSVARLNSITRKIDEGQGTLGRVVNDPTLINKVEDTVSDAQQIVGGVSRLQTEIELRSQYEVPFRSKDPSQVAGVKNFLALRLIPRPDKYYLLEAISDPRGTQTRRVVQTDSNGVLNSVEVIDTSFNTLKFSAEFAKRYYFLTLRFGIIENTGGLGADFIGLNERLELRFDAFDFTRRDPANDRYIYPRFRTTGMFNFMNHLWVQAGIDDPFNSTLRTWFLGGVLRFTDEDLKSLLVVAPKP